MPYKISWYEDKRVILVRIDGDMSIEDNRAVGNDLRTYIQNGTAPIHLIADVGNMGKTPTSIAEHRSVLGNLGQLSSSIVVGPKNPIVKFMAGVFAKLGGYEVRIVSTMDEATEVISRLDTSLQHLSPKKASQPELR